MILRNMLLSGELVWERQTEVTQCGSEFETRRPLNDIDEVDNVTDVALILIWRCDRGPSDILVGRAGECSFDADIRRTTLQSC